MPLKHRGFIDLPAHTGPGGFDHAAIHGPTGRLYVAHTANNAVDVIDLAAERYVVSVPGLPAVAGALVAEAPDLVFTSNRGENTVGIFTPTNEAGVEKVPVGRGPNGLAYDARRGRLLVAHVGDPAVAGSRSVSVIEVPARRRIADLPVAGRTRWTVFDPQLDAFHVNIADPPQIVVVGAGDPVELRRVVAVPGAGPHGLDIDVERRRLFCACDAGVLLELDADTGDVLAAAAIAGVPDVVFFNAGLGRVYVAIGDPGVIEAFDTAPLRRHETVTTETGAHTLAFDPVRNLVCAFLPATHRAALYLDYA
ncbi:MAG: YncE family protein [Candidatus Rokuibacteriota bacterium]